MIYFYFSLEYPLKLAVGPSSACHISGVVAFVHGTDVLLYTTLEEKDAGCRIPDSRRIDKTNGKVTLSES